MEVGSFVPSFEHLTCVSRSKRFCNSFCKGAGCCLIGSCILHGALPRVVVDTMDYKAYQSIKTSHVNGDEEREDG